MVNTELLQKAINNSGYKKEYIAKTLGLSRQGFKNKLDNKNEFLGREIYKLCDLLKITDLQEKERIFFDYKRDLQSQQQNKEKKK